MTDASKCRQRPAWRALWLWRWLYMLNDTERMEGKYDWTVFPRGLNIKASPTGNTVNLPRLPPQWGTRSTMSKNGPSARGLSKDKHTRGQTKVCTCVSIRTRTQTQFCLEYTDCVYSDSSCRPSLSYHCQLFFEISTSKCLSQSSGIVDLPLTDLECLRAQRSRIYFNFRHIRAESSRDAVLHAALTEWRTQPSLMAFPLWKEAVIIVKWADAERKAFLW